jgi:hypothetical protein
MTMGSQTEDDDEDFEESPVLDIRPFHPPPQSQYTNSYTGTNSHIRSQSTPSPVQTPTQTRDRSLRVQVPPTPTITYTPSHSALPTAPTTPRYPHLTPAHLPFLKTDPTAVGTSGEELPPPPPYEEIEWTVRVRTPRRVRSSVGLNGGW